MDKLLVDTDIFSYLMRGMPSVVESARKYRTVFGMISLIMSLYTSTFIVPFKLAYD